jgi:hypothetical protein
VRVLEQFCKKHYFVSRLEEINTLLCVSAVKGKVQLTSTSSMPNDSGQDTIDKDTWCEIDWVWVIESKLYEGLLLPYLIVKLGVHILGDFVLDVPGLGAGVEVTASQAHGLGQQPAEQLVLPVLTMSLLPGLDKILRPLWPSCVKRIRSRINLRCTA